VRCLSFKDGSQAHPGSKAVELAAPRLTSSWCQLLRLDLCQPCNHFVAPRPHLKQMDCIGLAELLFNLRIIVLCQFGQFLERHKLCFAFESVLKCFTRPDLAAAEYAMLCMQISVHSSQQDGVCNLLAGTCNVVLSHKPYNRISAHVPCIGSGPPTHRLSCLTRRSHRQDQRVLVASTLTAKACC